MRFSLSLVLITLSSLSFGHVNDPLCTDHQKQDELRQFSNMRVKRANSKIEEKEYLLKQIRPLMNRAQAQEAIATTLVAVDVALVGVISGALAGAGVGAGGLGLGSEAAVLMGWSGVGALSVKLYTDGTQKDSYSNQSAGTKPNGFVNDLKAVFESFDKLQEKYVDMKINEEKKIEESASKSLLPAGFFAYDALANKVSREEAQLELYKAEMDFASHFDKNLDDYCTGRFKSIKLSVQLDEVIECRDDSKAMKQ